MTKPPLDLSRLPADTMPLQVILFFSAALGVAAGIALLVLLSAVSLAFIPGGFMVMIMGAIAAGVAATRLIIMGVAAIILIPLAALVAAHLKLGATTRYIVEMTGAKILPETNRVGGAVMEMTRLAGLDQPPRYGILENTFNAFALSGGRETSLVLVGRTLAERLAPEETLAIIGHELGHVAMDDTKRKMLAIGHQEFLVRFLLFAGLKRWARNMFGLLGELGLAAHSRHREYWADAVGAYVTSPEAMISALRKLDGSRGTPSNIEKEFAPLMLLPISTLFSSHPRFSQRIEALQRRIYLDKLPVSAAAHEAEVTQPEVAPVLDGI